MCTQNKTYTIFKGKTYIKVESCHTWLIDSTRHLVFSFFSKSASPEIMRVRNLMRLDGRRSSKDMTRSSAVGGQGREFYSLYVFLIVPRRRRATSSYLSVLPILYAFLTASEMDKLALNIKLWVIQPFKSAVTIEMPIPSCFSSFLFSFLLLYSGLWKPFLFNSWV